MSRKIEEVAEDHADSGASRRRLFLIAIAVLCLVVAAAALFAVLRSDGGGVESDEEITDITFDDEGAATSLPAAPPGSRGIIGLSVESGKAGSKVRVQGVSFKAGKDFEPVDIYWDSTDGKPLATVDGPRFAVDVTIPKDAPVLNEGHNIIVVQKTKDGDIVNQTSLRYFVLP